MSNKIYYTRGKIIKTNSDILIGGFYSDAGNGYCPVCAEACELDKNEFPLASIALVGCCNCGKEGPATMIKDVDCLPEKISLIT